MKLDRLKNKKILIVGRGIEGKAVESYLRSHLKGAELNLVDQKDGEEYLAKQKNYDIAVKSPGVKPQLLRIPYTTATNIFLSNSFGKVIGITGTKGKSTTATLIYKMLKTQGRDVYLGGNIGLSPLSFIDNLNDNSWTVLEMSSYQLDDLKLSPARHASLQGVAGEPHIAVVLMITSEHLDYHKTQEKYIDAKRNILRFQGTSDFAIINRDYSVSHESEAYTQGKVFQVSRESEVENGCFIRNGKVIIRTLGKLGKSVHQNVRVSDGQTFPKNRQAESSEFSEIEVIDVNKIRLLGKHNLENVCAACMAASLSGVSKINIAKVLEEFGGLEHRLEFVGEKNGISFYNDSLSTIPEATIEALETLPDAETLIAGGHDRSLDYSSLAKYLNKGQINPAPFSDGVSAHATSRGVLKRCWIKTLILFPPTGIRIWEEICKIMSGGSRPQKFDVTTMEQAVRIAAAETSHGKTVLLSPASASFGIFKDYKDRGEQFKREVSRLKGT